MPLRHNAKDTKLGQRIAILGYTLREVSEGTGISRFDLNDYTHARRGITPGHMVRLCAFLRCQPESLID